MFRHSEHKRKRGGFIPFVILRLCLSLTILAVFAVAIYQAFLYFSGQTLTDFTKLNSPETLKTLLNSKDILKTASSIFGTAGVAIPGNTSISAEDEKSDGKSAKTQVFSGKSVLKFAIIADSHQDDENLVKALVQAKAGGAKFIIGLGDYSNTGTVEELEKAKKAMKDSGLPFYLTAGDHDLWEARNKGRAATSNVSQVFGSPYQSFSASNIRFVLVFNSDNYEGVDTVQEEWLESLLIAEDSRFINTFFFLHEPLYHPSSDRFMGSPVKADEGKEPNKKLVAQAERLRALFEDAGVAEVFAGDIHAFSRYDDPQFNLKMTTVGAVTAERNSQRPRYVMVDVLEDGRYNVEDIEVK